MASIRSAITKSELPPIEQENEFEASVELTPKKQRKL